ncbi:MAG: hypothetical protein CO075_03520 [Candidatus Moranbacteria bacterium CG_4_9_14_0_8_um_filter_41_43]|nr:MAG: hypothetical protein CO075_03520 [Candidatus Moranbacteria bacterium CG_4_9_14_0_8_um_filter_41_43]
MKYFMKKNPNAKKRDVAVKNRIQEKKREKKQKKTLLHPKSLGIRTLFEDRNVLQNICIYSKNCLY